MNAQAYSAVRTLVQALMGWLVGAVPVLGTLPASARSTIVEAIVSAICVGLWTYVVRWLETRPGDSFGARAARLAGRILMLGLGKQPVYPAATPNGPPTAVYSGSTGAVVKALPQ